MKIKQTIEQKLIPLEYLEEEHPTPKKRKQPVKTEKFTLSYRTRRAKVFPEVRVIPKSELNPSFVKEILKPKLHALPPLTALEEVQIPVKSTIIKFEEYPTRFPEPKVSLPRMSRLQLHLILKTLPSKPYYFEPPEIRVIDQPHIVLREITIFFEGHESESVAYPSLRVLPVEIEIPQFNKETKISREKIVIPTVQVLRIEEIQKISFRTSLSFFKESEVFPSIHTGNTNLQRLSVTTKILPAESGNTYPNLMIEEPRLKELLLATKLPSAENSPPTPKLRFPYHFYPDLTFAMTIPKKKEIPIPNTELLKETKIQMPHFGMEFTIIELPDNIEKFVNAEAEKMNGESLLSDLLNIKGYLPKGASEALDKPIFVLLGQDVGEWHYPIAYLLSELYKEIKGEKPNPTLRDFGEYIEDAKNVDSAKEVHLMVTFKPWGKIEILDGRRVEVSKIKSFFEKIRGRLGTAYLQGLGFFLVVAENRKIPAIENFLSQVKGVSKNTMLPEIPESKTLERYSALNYALLGIESDDFLRAIEKYEEALKKTVKVLSFFVPRGTDETQEHSFKESHQYPLKVAVFSYLIDLELKKLDERPAGDEFYKFIASLLTSGKVKIESPIRIGEREVIPDIIYNGNDKKAYIEIETLVGTEDPLKKIDMTIGKYLLDNRFVLDDHELWIVLRPVSALIHYEDLRQHQKLFKLLYGEVPVKFKVLVYRKGWELIDIETFARRIKDALKETKELRDNI